MNVVFSPRALTDLRGIQAYIAYDNVAAAARVANRIRSLIDLLPHHPQIGERYRGGPRRRLVVPNYPYCIYYRIAEESDQIIILTIQHTRRIQPTFSS